MCQRTDPYKRKLKYPRLQTILLGALKQSKRSRLPVLYPPQTLDEFFSRPPGGPAFIAGCEAIEPLQMHREDIQDAARLTLLIGPEGDFSDSEMIQAKAANFRPVSLGNNRLRSETAAIYGLSIFKMILGY